MMEFDEDIQQDYDEGNFYSLALVAQDLRNTMKHVAPRSWLAALKRKSRVEKREAEKAGE